MAVFSLSTSHVYIPPATRALTIATVVSSVFYYTLLLRIGDSTSFAPYFFLIPGSSLFYPWTFFTSAFVESSIIEFIFSLIVVLTTLSYLERLWGSIEMAKFIVVTVVASNIIAFVVNWLEYTVTKMPVFLYGQQYHGLMALQTGMLVGLTQIIPEHQIQIMGMFKVRIKTLPMAYVTFSTVMCIIGFQVPFIIIQFGWLVSYVWLRFYKKNSPETLSGGPAYGDRSETFAFVSWFPPLLHGPINILGNTVYNVANKFHLIPSSGTDAESGGYSQVPGGARAEAERRRAMALKALDQRVAAVSPTPPRTANGSAAPPRPGTSSAPPPPVVSSTSSDGSSKDITEHQSESR